MRTPTCRRFRGRCSLELRLLAWLGKRSPWALGRGYFGGLLSQRVFRQCVQASPWLIRLQAANGTGGVHGVTDPLRGGDERLFKSYS
jgi:hypothetical protein